MQELELGARGTAHHALVAGKTGSGKSTLMHTIITNLALTYSPDEVQLYLVDFKKGVEFQDAGLAPHSVRQSSSIATGKPHSHRSRWRPDPVCRVPAKAARGMVVWLPWPQRHCGWRPGLHHR